MTFIVGLTGGIGSGKSTVASMFQTLGAPIIDADTISHELVKSGQPAFMAIVQRFGHNILQPGGELDRAQLREIIFNEVSQRKWLEGLLHPLIYQSMVKKISEVNYPYCIVVIPLLAEQLSVFKPLLNHVLVLDVTPEQQLAWAAKRDLCSVDMIKKMIAAQATREERSKIADQVLVNDRSLVELYKQVEGLHQGFLKRN